MKPPFYRFPPPPLKDAGGASDPLPQETGTSTPSPNRPVRATPSPKRMLSAHAHHQWTLGAHQTPSPKRPVRAPPSPTDRYEQPLPPKGCRGRIISGCWGRIRPLPPTDRYEQPLPPTPTSLNKGVTDRAHS